MRVSSQNLTNGYNKVKFTAALKDNYVHNWDGSKCLYYQMHIQSTKAGTYREILFDEPNNFYAIIGDKKHLISSETVSFHLDLNYKKAIHIPLSELKRIIEKRGNKGIYKEYYFINKTVEKESQATVRFLDSIIEKNKNYYLVAYFDEGEIDFVHKAYILENEKVFNKGIYIATLFVAAPGIILISIICFLIFKKIGG